MHACACMRACMRACVHVCVCVGVCFCACVRAGVRVRARVCACVHACVRTCEYSNDNHPLTLCGLQGPLQIRGTTPAGHRQTRLGDPTTAPGPQISGSPSDEAG